VEPNALIFNCGNCDCTCLHRVKMEVFDPDEGSRDRRGLMIQLSCEACNAQTRLFASLPNVKGIFFETRI